MILRVVSRIQLQELTARIQFQDAKLADRQSQDMTDSDPKLIGDSTSYSHFWWKVNRNFPQKVAKDFIQAYDNTTLMPFCAHSPTLEPTHWNG